MTISNPVSGITRQMKADSHRDVYVKDETFSLAKQFAKEYLQAFLTGRPADVFKTQWSDIKDGALVFVQNKTHQIVRVLISGKLEKIVRRSSLAISSAKRSPAENGGKRLPTASSR
ncbi:hypothetical protein NB636_02120 [Oxalobacter aliiformigenes]|uniref:hypothetical protein n=1 Tax=Oxalobacter aliiformigenes TaxID=2946593 RepID=UPI0022AF5882|nr:hypothetical protein [Oxalobacter aliiformigenes]MCZ4065669.1 hypothetical protein [Oxalobacter aliiformigenes]WAV99684.1 hypothetical protein NB636_02120 [Oxalobacter aliiformigenes]